MNPWLQRQQTPSFKGVVMHKDKLSVFNTPPNMELEEYKLSLKSLAGIKEKAVITRWWKLWNSLWYFWLNSCLTFGSYLSSIPPYRVLPLKAVKVDRNHDFPSSASAMFNHTTFSYFSFPSYNFFSLRSVTLHVIIWVIWDLQLRNM